MADKQWDDLVDPARAALEALITSGDNMTDRIEELEAENKRLKALVADVVYSTGDDPEIMAASRAEWAARALAAEAKLAKAVEAVRSQHGDPDNENGIALAEAAILALITEDAQAALDRVVSARFGVVRSEVVRLSAEGKIDSEATERLLAAIRKGGE